MIIRKPKADELEKVISLSPKAMFDGTLGKVKPTTEKAAQLVDSLLERGSYYLIATDGHELMGWILLGSSKDQFKDKTTGFIYELFVLESFRGRGISKKLMRSGIDSLKNEGYSEIRLSVFSGNKAIELYEKMGFNKRTVTMSLEF
ncbi:GNAT family N-acetyltransferase [Halobacillus halophilus]|uniref:GNAT family N-acetyltransferase n=1 Tax=Halobacillus halophilus TaxID=1570 RepID=UPI001CD33516|nr:GNAT family N-acetyltransferase [Halobacillus halophilus]MCA1011690.1 GNAT family N-acetyltransferase [Halobacillus halophilus]